MAKQAEAVTADAADGKKRLDEEKKQLKKDQKQQRKEAKQRAKEIAKQEEELGDESNGLLTFGATVLIVALWLAVIGVVIKLDVGGLGSNVLTPILKDIPVINMVLPGNSITETTNSEAYGGYTSLKDAIEQIKALELELERAQSNGNSRDEEITNLKAEVIRLQEFEKKQVEFQRIKTEFYEEVIYAENGPGADEYIKYYESMDPTTAEYLYKQAVIQKEESQEIQDYVKTYSEMKPKQAAAIFESMTDNLSLVAKILQNMKAADRGPILAAMDSEVAAKLTKIMDPES